MVHDLISSVRDVVWGLPFLGFIVAVECIITVALGFIQVRNFLKSCRLVLGGRDEDVSTMSAGDMSPFQAFLSALSVSIGNGSLAGVATAIYMGGPGAAFWMFLIGFLGMALRFSEVFLGVSFAMANAKSGKSVLGGPFLYIDKLPFGAVLATAYAGTCLFYGLASGNAMQCNSISTAVHEATGLSTIIIGAGLFLFMLYVMFGGAKRIVKVSDAIVPVKVALFFSTMIIVLVYHWAALIPAILLIIKSAFNPVSAFAGVAGLTIQRMFAIAASRAINATEAGLGTAAVFYGNTGSKEPYNDATSSMLSTFISNNIVAFMVALSLVASGVWDSGQDGAVLVASAYRTVFGIPGGWIVALLSISFGMGVFVAYGYVTRQCWLYLTGGRFETLFVFLFAGIAFVGSITSIQMVWAVVDLGVAACLFINLSALLYLMPYIRAHLAGTK